MGSLSSIPSFKQAFLSSVLSSLPICLKSDVSVVDHVQILDLEHGNLLIEQLSCRNDACKLFLELSLP